jgi:hypothetical protein
MPFAQRTHRDSNLAISESYSIWSHEANETEPFSKLIRHESMYLSSWALHCFSIVITRPFFLHVPKNNHELLKNTGVYPRNAMISTLCDPLYLPPFLCHLPRTENPRRIGVGFHFHNSARRTVETKDSC